MPPKATEKKVSLVLPTKRKQPGPSDNAPFKPDDPYGRQKRRDDREIATQHPELALKDGELNLQAFLKSQEFAIKAFEESMRHTKAEATSRAFQQVPRGLRRRTASHNAKRVPKRLRWKAIKEMTDDNTPIVIRRNRRPTTTRGKIRAETAKRLGILAEKKRKRKLKAAHEKAAAEAKEKENNPADAEVTKPKTPQVTIITRPARPKIRRNELNETPKPKSKFRKRQINKTWLPTHLWHAKRARMTPPKKPLWRFAVPLTPNEKIYRATHRAQGERGTLAWDMSYFSTIGLYGNERGVEQVLRKLGVTNESCWNDKGRRWREGTRHWSWFLSRETRAGRRDICPVTIIWNPKPFPNADNDGEPDPKKTTRQLFLRVHPSAFLELFNELVRLVKMQNPRLFIEDLRFEVGSIELTGPASTETLMSILHPYHTKDDSREPHAEIFKRLTSDVLPASMPPNALLGFSVLDPRLRYPPRKVTPPDQGDETVQTEVLDMLARWPAADKLAPFGMFERDARFKASSLPSEKSINRRKGAKTPGSYLKPEDADPPIPVLLLASRPAQGTQAQGTWTLLAPFKCILPLWASLVHVPLWSGGNPRFAGLNEARQVPFERGLPCFPYDYLGTDSGAEWEAEQRAKRRWEWARRPKSKRIAWESLDLGAGRKGEVGDGWACDFEHIFGLKAPETAAVPAEDAMDIDDPPKDPKASKQASKPTKPAKEAPSSESLKPVYHTSKSAFQDIVSSKSTAAANSIITVTLSFTSRGVASPCARIYRLPSLPEPASPAASAEVPASVPPPRVTNSSTALPLDLREQWLAQLPTPTPKSSSAKHSAPKGAVRVPADADVSTTRRLLAQTLTDDPVIWPPPKPNQKDMSGHPLVPGEDDLIGFVTTGAFSLSEGRGTAVGCIAVEKVIADVKEKRKGRVDEGKLCIIRNAGESVGWLARWEVA